MAEEESLTPIVQSECSRIGNDVMDLLDPRCRGRTNSDRLLERMLVPAEREWLEAAPNEDRWIVRLWSFWAAKETAFKIRCKLPRAEGVFMPGAFICRMEEETEDAEGLLRIRGVVRCPDMPIPVMVTGASNRRHVHVVGWSGGGDRSTGGRLETGLEKVNRSSESSMERLRAHFTPAEWEGIYSLSSAQVRLLARERIRSLLGSNRTSDPAVRGDTPIELVTTGTPPRRTPPRILVGGRELEGWDLSLSHHGRYVAWALLVPE